MARLKKQPPIDVFQRNIDDARQLLAFAEGLANYRVYRMRKELREAIGFALRYRKKDRDTLDCIESRTTRSSSSSPTAT